MSVSNSAVASASESLVKATSNSASLPDKDSTKDTSCAYECVMVKVAKTNTKAKRLQKVNLMLLSVCLSEKSTEESLLASVFTLSHTYLLLLLNVGIGWEFKRR